MSLSVIKVNNTYIIIMFILNLYVERKYDIFSIPTHHVMEPLASFSGCFNSKKKPVTPIG
jgi:hypothetical protein